MVTKDENKSTFFIKWNHSNLNKFFLEQKMHKWYSNIWWTLLLSSTLKNYLEYILMMEWFMKKCISNIVGKSLKLVKNMALALMQINEYFYFSLDSYANHCLLLGQVVRSKKIKQIQNMSKPWDQKVIQSILGIG